jgi:hypothetical protein
MRILVGHRGSIDFDEPIELDESKKQKFIEFIKTLFDPSIVEVSPKGVSRRERLGEKIFRCLGMVTNTRFCWELTATRHWPKNWGSWMSVVMQRGFFLPDFDAWCAQNGYSRKGDCKDLIKKYLEEKELHKKQRRKRAQLLECTQCGMLHLPEYGSKDCYSCGGHLRKNTSPTRRETNVIQKST